MASFGRLELEFVDVDGRRLTGGVDIVLRHRVLSDQRRIDAHDASRPIRVGDLHVQPQGLYILQVEADAYWPVSRFVTIPPDGDGRQTVTMPIRPDRARAVFPEYDALDDRVQAILDRSGEVRGHEGLTGRALFAALSDEAKAGLLNIAIKSLATPFKNGEDLLQHVTLLSVLGDRCFVDVPRALMDQMADFVEADLFRQVSGSLHRPPPGFSAAGSFKTADAFGNLQMTFFDDGQRCVADVDIDDEAGLGHVFQVVRNRVTGSPTHPFNIHQILVAHQHLDPGYRLFPRAA